MTSESMQNFWQLTRLCCITWISYTLLSIAEFLSHPLFRHFFLNYHIIASSLNQSQSLRSSQDSVWLSFLYQSTECMRWEKPIDVMCHYIVKEETYPSLGNSCLISTWWWLRSSAVFELKTWKTHQYNYVGCYKICLKLMSQWSA